MFKTSKWKEPVYKCKETNKISRTADGTIIYRSKCKQTGTRSVSSTNKPIIVPAWAAAGINPGALLKYTMYPNGVTPDRGWPHWRST